MNRAEILAKVTEVLADILDRSDLQLTEATTADSVEDWDSVNHVKLLIGLEGDLGIEFETDEVSKLSDVGALLNLIERKVGKA